MSSKDQHPANVLTFQKGKYVFTDHLKVVHPQGLSVPFLTAEAILITDNNGSPKGDIATVKVSDLILKQSTFIDDDGRSLEAHKLYVWPRNLGSTQEWTANKLEFLNQFVLNFPIEIISSDESNGVTWKYITPEYFKKIPEAIEASADFQEYAAHQSEYFFLRRPLKEIK
ncbi:hypothetical protein TH53_15530 [Pedobacter lusitanus]|uniref:Uncharacterized protein n=1 Tax=Pedobacter lusitanus TaxID=1503925 RepID=A0A0D0F490_9SPHI|nr:hypothetical protein [Pedobacter lusitanus]KIO76358.1 hypothetical protein TH53_15530 [Pedobacter lusitanus]